MKTYEAVAQAVIAEGCRSLFGVMGDGNMFLWSALAATGQVSIYSPRHEASAVGMADGYHRATGEVALATVTWGPGVTQATTPLVVAARNRSALILLVGQVARESKDRTQYLDHKRFAELCGLAYHEVTSPRAAAQQVAEAFYAARVLRQAVLLDIAMDVQLAEIKPGWRYAPAPRHAAGAEGCEPDAVALRQVFEGLSRAERPVLIAGQGARAAGAREEIIGLAERSGALLATTLPAKGYFSDCAFDLGVAGGFATAPAEKLLRAADYVVGFGAELGHFTTEGGALFPAAAMARIDIRPAPAELGETPGLYVRGDARKAARQLRLLFEETGLNAPKYRSAATRAALDARPALAEPPGDGLDPRRLLQHLSTALPERTRIISGVGHYWGFVAMYLGIGPDVAQILTYQFGSIAQAFHQALGAAAARTGHVNILIEGDGSLLVDVQEIETAVRHGLPLVIVVLNDGGFGAEVHKLRAKGFDPSLASWPAVDFVRIARAFGAEGRTLAREEEIAGALDEGVRSGGVFLIDARISPTLVSDRYGKLHFGAENQAPLLRAATEARAR